MRTDVARSAAPEWRVTAASRRGSSHDPGTPNQDAVRVASVTDEDGAQVLVAAVSDGHGGPRYVRSDVGSQLAVDVAVDHLAAVLGREPARTPPVEVIRREVPSLVAGWHRAVEAHHGRHPFSTEELARLGGAAGHDVALAYGATLIVALLTDAGVGIGQIGDGDALIRTNGFVTRPVPGDPRLVAGETTSLCLSSAVDDFRFASLPGTADADLLLLATDGYGNSFADADWWQTLVGDLAWFLDAHDFEDFEDRFPAWLQESATVGGDDVSAVVLARVPLVVAPSTTRREPAPEEPAARPAGSAHSQVDAPAEVSAPRRPPGALVAAAPAGRTLPMEPPAGEHGEPPAAPGMPDEPPGPGDEPAGEADPEPTRTRGPVVIAAVCGVALVAALVLGVVLLLGTKGSPGGGSPSETTPTPGGTPSVEPTRSREPRPTGSSPGPARTTPPSQGPSATPTTPVVRPPTSRPLASDPAPTSPRGPVPGP